MKQGSREARISKGLILPLVFLAWGCGSESEQLADTSDPWTFLHPTKIEKGPSHSPTSKEKQEALVAGIELPQPEVISEKPVKVSEPKTPTTPIDFPKGSPTPSAPSAPGKVSTEVVWVDFEKGTEQLLRFDPASLHHAAALLTERGINKPVRGDDLHEPAVESGMVPMGLSWGTDNREWAGFWAPWPYTTVGVVHARGGTGTLVGRRVVLTCAHCIVDDGANPPYYWPQPWYFAPRQSGSGKPWGNLEVQGFMVGNHYLLNDCGDHQSYEPPDCVPQDWALLVLKDEFPLGHPGWLGYADLNLADTISAPHKRAPGYPGCGADNSPFDGVFDCRNCNHSTAWTCNNFQWGQPFSCSIGEFRYSNLAFTHGCDISGGHSGGPVFYNQSGNYYVIGQTVVEACDTCVGHPETANPNTARRIDQNLLGVYRFIEGSFSLNRSEEWRV